MEKSAKDGSSDYKLLPAIPAWSLAQRVRGLLGRDAPPAGTGLLLFGCHAIHTLGMRYPIDVMFLDQDYRILAVHASVPPGSRAKHKGAVAAVEMAGGEASRLGLTQGDVLLLCLTAWQSGRKKKVVGLGLRGFSLLRD